MKNKNLMLGIMVMLGISALGVSNASATNYFVRDGGGNPTQCTGTTNAVYPGSGTSQPCAFNNPRYAIGWDMDSPQPGTMNGGDTLFIDGDSDTNPGQQAQYLIGYDNTGANTTPDCSSFWPYDCVLTNLPAGINASQPTSVIGTGTHKPQLWGNERIWQVLSANNNYITLQWLEITDHDACAYNDPVSGCNYGGPYPYGAWSEDGITIGGTGLTITDVYVHGLGRYGINVSDGTTSMGDATFTRLWVIGNGYGGFTTGINDSLTGTFTFNQPMIEWNGCVEAYPLSKPGIDNPANYSQCFGQNSGGYGDGLAFGPNGHLSAGNWTITGPGSISFNTQDGLDTLHGNGTGTIQVDKMRFEGNAGNQVKMNAVNSSLTNSIVIGDCGWWLGAPQSYSGFTAGDVCRALGDAVLVNVTNNSMVQIYNNTIFSNGNIALESEDLNATGCNGATSINVRNNIVLGGYAWIDDTTFNGSGGNAETTYIYNDGNDGNGGGTCGSLKWNEDYNIVFGTKNNNQGCLGANDKCGTNPGFSSALPLGTAGGAENTFYQGNLAESLFTLSSSSPAISSGVTGLNYWNNGNDFHNVTRTSPPSLGGLELNSCAANTFGCLYNSDCCTGSCNNFVCGTANSKPQPVVSLTSPTNASSFSAGSNVTITSTAAEPNGSISNISVYNGATLLGSSSVSPYNYVINNISAGTYSITAQATDANGVTVTSNPVSVTVVAQSILPSLPVVALTNPVNGSSFSGASDITVSASASEINGTIAQVQFFDGALPLSYTGTGSPYNYTWKNVQPGTYTLTAVATDLNGVSVTSNPVTFTVAAPPIPVVTIPVPSPVTAPVTVPVTTPVLAPVTVPVTTPVLAPVTAPVTTPVLAPVPAPVTVPVPTPVPAATAVIINPTISITSPGNNASFTVPSDITLTSKVSGNITRVDYYAGPIYLGESYDSPFTVVWSSAQQGTYSIIAKATDNNGMPYYSTPVKITVRPHTPPTVGVTAQFTGMSSSTAVNLVLKATASVTGGSITKVDFYDGYLYLGTVYSAPYNLNWYNVQFGTHHLIVKATDSYGWSTTSPSVNVPLSTQTVKAMASKLVLK